MATIKRKEKPEIGTDSEDEELSKLEYKPLPSKPLPPPKQTALSLQRKVILNQFKIKTKA